MARNRLITPWNVAALFVVVACSALTLLADQLWLQHWSKSGIRAQVGVRHDVLLPAGETLVYYESAGAVPNLVTLTIFAQDGRRVHTPAAGDDNSFKMAIGGWSGRSLWNVRIPEDGLYAVRCFPASAAEHDEPPASDRVVFYKQPNSLREAMIVRAIIQINGGTLTVLLGGLLYFMHWRTLRRKRLTDVPDEHTAATHAVTMGA
jgi:hypothetical protein